MASASLISTELMSRKVFAYKQVYSKDIGVTHGYELTIKQK